MNSRLSYLRSMNRSLQEVPLCDMLGIEFPLIVAPMFLVSNENMIIAATKAGVTGAIPALNYRTIDELRSGIRNLKEKAAGPFGINLIVNRSNVYLKDQLLVCCEERVDFIITSLGSPEEVINKAHENE
jgi:nitronate monooxygenase